jgi:hypothetical protein
MAGTYKVPCNYITARRKLGRYHGVPLEPTELRRGLSGDISATHGGPFLLVILEKEIHSFQSNASLDFTGDPHNKYLPVI